MSVEIVDFDARPGEIDGLVIVTPKQVTDGRGTIRELFRRSAFEAAGVSLRPFEQINVTESGRGALRGMHAEAMTKLLTVAAGEALGAYVDLRTASATFGTVTTVSLRPGVQVLVPPGVANGFQALTDRCAYVYCFDTEWQPDMAGDSCSPLGLGVDWPIPVDVDDPNQISTKDATAPTLDELRRRQEGAT
ncbi:MAG: dTDP-4-dehydrorhamnose 3,5-epimerase family protein [Acidimicrobiia bacterium]